MVLRRVVQANRSVVSRFVWFCGKQWGRCDESERVFFEAVGTCQQGRVLEIGGANRPLFRKADTLEYIGIDIDQSFDWEFVYSRYFSQSVELPVPELQADLIVSKYLLEHVPNNHLLLANLKAWLAPGGLSVHIFPCGWHPYSIANRMVGNRIAKWLIPLLRPGSEGVTGYPAYYHLCNSWALERTLKASGMRYEVHYFWGAEDYFGFFAPLGVLMHLFNRACAALGLTIFASNAVLILYGSDRPAQVRGTADR
jgi:SAM-dependent methyltransferase